MPSDTYRLFAIRYAHNSMRPRGRNFIADPDPLAPSPMDFFCWAAISETRTIAIDTGMGREHCEARGHIFLRNPLDALRTLDARPERVTDLVLTHFHLDHIGHAQAFAAATIHASAREMAFATGAPMRHAWLREAYDGRAVADLIHALHAGRLRLRDDDAEIAPGLSFHVVGGHTAGQALVRVNTPRGPVVLASDAIHYMEELERRIPFAIAHDLGAMLDAHDRILDLAGGADHIVPGHDPRELARYPAAGQGLEDWVLALHERPGPAGQP